MLKYKMFEWFYPVELHDMLIPYIRYAPMIHACYRRRLGWEYPEVIKIQLLPDLTVGGNANHNGIQLNVDRLATRGYYEPKLSYTYAEWYFAVLGHEIAHVWQGFACGEGWPDVPCESLACVLTVLALKDSGRYEIMEKEDRHLRLKGDSEYARLLGYQLADSHFLRRLFQHMMKKYNIRWSEMKTEEEKVAKWKQIVEECKP